MLIAMHYNNDLLVSSDYVFYLSLGEEVMPVSQYEIDGAGKLLVVNTEGDNAAENGINSSETEK